MNLNEQTLQIPLEYAESIQRILAEFKRQDAKFGPQDHNAHEWEHIIGEEFGEAATEFAEIAAHFGRVSKAINEQAYKPVDEQTAKQYIKELLETAACCIRAAVNAETRFLQGGDPANELVLGKRYRANLIVAGKYPHAWCGRSYFVTYLGNENITFSNEEGRSIHAASSDFDKYEPLLYDPVE